ncbi:Zinc finger MYM-type protein 1 [Linum perenne]
MRKFLVKRARTPEIVTTSNSTTPTPESNSCVFDNDALEADPELRNKISLFHPNVQDEVRRVYLLRGQCQPRGHSFPFRDIGGRKRRFNPAWFDDYDWLEYNIKNDAAYCLKCYLFRNEISKKGAKKDYRIRLEASIDCVTWLLHNGLALRGHDESESSTSKGNFLELLQFHVRGRDHIESVVLKNAPKNLLMTSPDVQRDIVNAIATETTKAIINDIGDDLFTILVDEARDVSVKEQMAIVLRYVNKEGSIVERFLGISHYMLVTHGLSLSRIRGQGYDGASNMKGEINGLKTLILAENSAAYYVHGFFTMLSSLIKLVGSSCKRRDNIRDSQATKDQDIVNAMRLVHVAKLRLQEMRDNGWEPLLDDVLSFCNKESIPVSNMDDLYFPHNKGRQKAQPITNLHRFKVDLFYTVVDMQLQELNNRFDEVSTELLCCVACLNPDDLFIAFDKQKFVKLATFYPEDFSIHDISFFGFQLETYVHEMKLDERFKGLKGIAELSRRMVETGKHFMYPKVYLLIRLAILLPVATASVERAFSAMSYIKNKLRNRIRDELLNDCLVVYIEKNVASSLEKECIVQYFQNMKTRRGVL